MWTLVPVLVLSLTQPYPPSPLVDGLELDFSQVEQRAPGSDNWPCTWADDGHLYTCWGDGGGFGGTNQRGRVSLGVARIEGDAEGYRGTNLWGGADADAPATFGGKSYGILAVANTLHMWVSPGSGLENNREARLATSTDGGLTWSRADWAFSADDEILMPTFCQFGPGNDGAPGGYAYMYAARLVDPGGEVQVPGEVWLMRAPEDDLSDRSAYEFFAGTDAAGEPVWSAEMGARQPVFSDPRGVREISALYHPELARYLLLGRHGPDRGSNFGMFDSPTPWGPWTTVAYEDGWGGYETAFFWCVPTKWLGEGLSFGMVFTGTGDLDAWNCVPGRFIRSSR
jgi:hypothetical protein